MDASIKHYSAHRLAIILFAILIAGANVQTTPQGEQKAETSNFKFSVQTQLVEIFFTVTKGKYLAANLLTASDFQISEDGNPASIDSLSSQETPLQIVLLVDISESVESSLSDIQDAAIAFVQSLNRDDRITLAFFNSSIQYSSQASSGREPIIQEIKNAKAHGLTKLYDALLFGMKHLDGKPGRKALVCFSDGEDTCSTAKRPAAMDAVARYGYPIYVIGAGAGLELANLKMTLQQFADVNGGKAFFIQNLRKLRQAFVEVASELRFSYVLHYYTHVPSDGQWHDISISALNPDYTVHTRKGYYARTGNAAVP
jgi:VWFA-related protein